MSSTATEKQLKKRTEASLSRLQTRVEHQSKRVQRTAFIQAKTNLQSTSISLLGTVRVRCSPNPPVPSPTIRPPRRHLPFHGPELCFPLFSPCHAISLDITACSRVLYCHAPIAPILRSAQFRIGQNLGQPKI